MAFLLDTCLVSELWKPKPNAGVVDWLEESVEDELFMSVLSIGEIRRGIDRLPPGRKRERLNRDLVTLRSRFSSRVLPISDVVADRWGALSADATRAGKQVHVVDGFTRILLQVQTLDANGACAAVRHIEDD